MTCTETLWQVFICLMPPSHLGFCLGWSGNFIGSESGQTQSVELLQNVVSNTTQHPPTRPLPATHCLYILYFDFGKGEREFYSLLGDVMCRTIFYVTLCPREAE